MFDVIYTIFTVYYLKNSVSHIPDLSPTNHEYKVYSIYLANFVVYMAGRLTPTILLQNIHSINSDTIIILQNILSTMMSIMSFKHIQLRYNSNIVYIGRNSEYIFNDKVFEINWSCKNTPFAILIVNHLP